MIEESGLHKPSDNESLFKTFDSVLSINSRESESCVGKVDNALDDDKEESTDGAYVQLLNKKIAEVNNAMKDVNKDGSRSELKKIKGLREKKEDFMRLKRVEQIYVSSE